MLSRGRNGPAFLAQSSFHYLDGFGNTVFLANQLAQGANSGAKTAIVGGAVDRLCQRSGRAIVDWQHSR